MENREISKIFEHIGKLLELKGETVFKTRAYYNAARVIDSLPYSIESAVENDSVKNIIGIGEALEKKIKEIVSTGRLEYLDRLEKEIPSEIVEMLRIPGLGPKKIFKLVNSLGIKNINELEAACRENFLAILPGFGIKTQENILKGISLLKVFSERVLFSEAESISVNIIMFIKNIPQIMRTAVTGSVRRCMETVKDIDIVISTEKNSRDTVIEKLSLISGVKDVFEKGPTKTSVRLKSGIVCNFRIVDDSEFIFALHHFTGSAAHNTALRSYAKTHGLKINEYGIFKEGKILKAKDETELFTILGMSFIPPEMRENSGEIEAALENKLPVLIVEENIKGIFHIHTNWSDGAESIPEIALTAEEMGYEYVGISDHSYSAGYTGGLSPERVLRQFDEIDKFNEKHKGIKIFKGIESDILRDGSLDYEDKILEQFDFVIGSVHSWFTMTEKEATERIVKAVSNPFIIMLGHPTGRLLLTREGYPVDMEKILDACAEHKVIIELNANPQRLDIDWRYLRTAKERGIKISINPDSHNKETLYFVRYGINIARKGWLTKKDVLNTGSYNQVAQILKAKKS